MSKNSIFWDQAEFMRAADHVVGTHEKEAPIDQQMLALRLVEEEFKELLDERLSTVESLKEAIDLIYTAAQYVNSVVGPEKATALWDLIHKNNMSKTVDGKLIKREDGKVQKPVGYKKLTYDDIAKAIGW